MGQKTNPIGLRLGIIKSWESRWFSEKNYSELLQEDINLRRFLMKRLSSAGISKIVIERPAKLANITRGSVKVGGGSNAPTDLDAKAVPGSISTSGLIKEKSLCSFKNFDKDFIELSAYS